MKKSIYLIFFLLLLSTSYGFSQSKIKAKKISVLPEIVFETSGLIYYNGFLYTINDSRHGNYIFQLDTLGNLIRKININNAKNNDWEDLSQDEQYIYIGDFGNNGGNRKNLKIYSIAKNQLNKDTVLADSICFKYPNQTNFNNNFQNHDFDCEAFFCKGDSLYLFSKSWNSKVSRIYCFPKIPGNYTASLIDSIKFDFLICGATCNESENAILLIGYKYNKTRLKPYIVKIKGFNNNNFSNSIVKAEKINLCLSQTESITCSDNNIIYIAREGIKIKNIVISKPKLYKFPYICK